MRCGKFGVVGYGIGPADLEFDPVAPQAIISCQQNVCTGRKPQEPAQVPGKDSSLRGAGPSPGSLPKKLGLQIVAQRSQLVIPSSVAEIQIPNPHEMWNDLQVFK